MKLHALTKTMQPCCHNKIAAHIPSYAYLKLPTQIKKYPKQLTELLHFDFRPNRLFPFLFPIKTMPLAFAVVPISKSSFKKYCFFIHSNIALLIFNCHILHVRFSCWFISYPNKKISWH